VIKTLLAFNGHGGAAIERKLEFGKLRAQRGKGSKQHVEVLAWFEVVGREQEWPRDRQIRRRSRLHRGGEINDGKLFPRHAPEAEDIVSGVLRDADGTGDTAAHRPAKQAMHAALRDGTILGEEIEDGVVASGYELPTSQYRRHFLQRMQQINALAAQHA